MSRLKVVLRGTVISEIELSPEKEYVGGRKEGCDIRLQPEKGISREHFKLKFTDGKWQIIAISRFGDVFSLGQKIEQADLQHGQSFHVPPYDFTFLDVPEVGASPADRPKINLEINENTRTILGAAPQMPYIKVVNSKGEIREMLRLEVGEVWVAGRDPSCQIIIPDQRVSRRQFEVHKMNGTYTLLDLASVNGTFLNGTPVSSTDPQGLKSGDSISVLDNVMYFELHDPNFKYKVENIEIPPLQLEPEPIVMQASTLDRPPIDEVEVAGEEEIEEVSEIEEVEEDGGGYDSSMPVSVDNGPFTGMPGDQPYDNQFYTFDQQQGTAQPGASTQEPLDPTAPPKKKKLSPIAMVLIAVIVLGGAYYYMNMMDEPVETPKVAINENDPFSKLTPAQQKEVEENYSLAEQMHLQQKYDLALEKIRKIEELLPEGFKESNRIKQEAEQANLTIIQKQKDEEAAKEAAEREAKLKQVLENCKKLLSPDVTSAQMNECLAPIAAIDPNNADYIKLLAQAADMESEKEQKALAEKNYETQVAEFQELYDKASKTQSEGYAFKAIRQYKLVLDSKLPDPKKLKAIAEQRIAFIEEKIKAKSETSLAGAEALYKQGKFKEAIVTLRDSVVYDPENAEIKDRIEAYTYELTKQVRSLYQESIIDENYGLIDNTETKQGAKEKWKKITDMDLEDGEYYRKAIIKLRRYGVM
jgi:hypothetical protein